MTEIWFVIVHIDDHDVTGPFSSDKAAREYCETEWDQSADDMERVGEILIVPLAPPHTTPKKV